MFDNSRGSSREDLTLWWFLKPGRIFLFIILVAVFLYLAVGVFNKVIIEAKPTCGDGSFYGTCSLRKPYFCDEEGNLAEKANLCGCPDNIAKKGEKCISQYETGGKEIQLKYFLDGEEKSIDYVIYSGMADYLSGISDAVYYEGDEIPFRTDFKLKNLNNKEQRQFLLKLVTEIQNAVHDENGQARIAISFVQNIPWGSSEKTVKFENGEVGYSRKAYEVLYENEGLCGEKSELLAFLLRELGYGVVLFYNNDENHESVGIKCPVEKSWHGTGYCFVETSGPSILSDTSIEYVGGKKLDSEPEVLLISNGKSLGGDLQEYRDAGDMMSIRERNILGMFKFWKLNDLRRKYGLADSYNLG